MKRILSMLACIILLAGCLCISVSAESAASSVNLMCTVNSEGACLATMTVNLRLEEAIDDLEFPLPLDAKNITLNNSPVSTSRSAAATLVDISKLSKDYVGELVLRFEYTIPEAVQITKINEGTKDEDWVLQLVVPLLSGFDHPVESLNFTITMPPGNMPNRPSLTSIYRQASIESDIPFKVAGSQIIGSTKTVLNDHEGVTLTMIVTEEMFPTVSTYVREGNPELPYIIVCAVLALLYWILTLRTWPIIRMQTTTPPEGITAGELGCRLTLSGGDLTMMVMSWAQLGYIIIQLDNHGRILLHKRMDMGNERSLFEVRVFQMLFGKNKVIDGTGSQYARLCCKVARMVPGEKTMYSASSGNIKLFRFLCCASHVCAGVNVGMNLSSILALQILLAVILAIVAAITSWHIQEIAYRTHIRGKIPVYFGLGFILLWVLLGLLAGQVWIPLGSAFGQWALGYFAAYGGRRSDLGRVSASQILGLRAYLKTIPKEELLRLRKLDPDYFFNMAPYALALGIIQPFARCFAGKKMDPCPYIISGVRERRTAAEWASILAATADRLDERQRRMQVEKWAAIRFR